MLAAILTSFLTMLLPFRTQAPADPVPGAVEVRGMAELSPAAAADAAWAEVQLRFRTRWLEQAQQTARVHLPRWLPQWVWQPSVERWVDSKRAQDHLAVVHRDETRREHDFGTSHQVTLWVTEPDSNRVALERQLRGEFRSLAQRLAAKCGGTVLFWLLLAVFVGWVDRLSMGWMTRSLRFTGLLAAVGVPLAAILL